MAFVAANIASGRSTSSTPRASLLPTVLLGVGPVVGIVLIVGLVVLLAHGTAIGRRLARRGFLIFLVILLITEGKAYYPAAFLSSIAGGRRRSDARLDPHSDVATCAGHCAGDHLAGDHAVPDSSACSRRFADATTHR